jgi:hypothetical protein
MLGVRILRRWWIRFQWVVGGKGVDFDRRLGGKPSSRWSRWLNHLDGIARVVFRPKTRWAPNAETK